MIMAGGTGGHVFPGARGRASCCARAAATSSGSARARGMEARARPAAGYPDRVDRGRGPARQGTRCAGCWRRSQLCARCAQARAASSRRRPDVVLGCGGFASVPRRHGGLAARHAAGAARAERGRRPRQPRARARRRRASLGAFRGSFPAPARARSTRQPGARARSPRCRRRGSASPARNGPLRLLVVGGSLGAQR